MIHRTLAIAFSALLLVSSGEPLHAEAPLRDPPPGTYRYAISYPWLGRIGTFTNRIRSEGDRTAVESRMQIDARVLFLTVHYVRADRIGIWRRGRLIRFSGKTDNNGKVSHVAGRADGDGFTLDTPNGRIEAPADVFPANPWSIRFTEARTMMNTERGNLGHVVVREDPNQVLRIAGRAVETRHFTVSGDGDGEVWYGPSGTPLRFSFKSHGHPVTFTIESAPAGAGETLAERKGNPSGLGSLPN